MDEKIGVGWLIIAYFFAGYMCRHYSLEHAARHGCGALCFEGNIDFYGKSGFDYASKFGIRYHGLPEGEDAFFLIAVFIP